MDKVQIGAQVPNFTLPASNGEQVSLEQFRGTKIVIYFYPADNTPTCTQEACDFRDYHGDYAKLNTVVLGVSPDPINAHNKFIAKYELPFLLLSDTEREVCELFDVWKLKKMYGREYMGVERSTFLLNEQGVLVKEWRKVKIKQHVQQVLEAIREM
jgi:thioredoxin-dependent peroxiredoxin